MNFNVGDIIDYSYLWGHQADAGEESGRKYRPTCMVFKSQSTPENLYLFPITSKKPTDGRPFKEITALECHRANLKSPSYIILNEFNVAQSDMLFDVGNTKPLGTFSDAYMREVVRDILVAGQKQRPKEIKRSAG